MQRTKKSLLIKLAAIAAAVSVQGVALAASPAASDAQPPAAQAEGARAGYHHKKMHGPHRHHGPQLHRAAMWVPGYGPLGEKTVKDLALNDNQQKLLDQAREAQKAARAEGFKAMQESRKAQLEALKSGKIDPRAALKQSQEAREKGLQERRQIDEKWLAVWDSLDDGQRQKATAHFSERAQKMADLMARHAERAGKAPREKAPAPAES